MKTDKLFLRGRWAAILLCILCLALVGEVSADETVELRLVPYDRPDVTVDELDEERPIVNPVSTAQGVEMRQVGVAVTCWARNVRLDGQSVFERYHGRKYVGRVPVVKKKLEPGKHTIWPGEHTFTVTDEGELQSGSPALEIEENVVRIKCYPVTIEAYQSSGPGLSGTMRQQALPEMTLREAEDAWSAAEDNKKKPRELLPVFEDFAPLRIWLPPNTAGAGYLLHPVGLTFQLDADGVKVGSGEKGRKVDGIKTAKNKIRVPLRVHPVRGDQGSALVVLGVHKMEWERESGLKEARWYPRHQPYEVQIAEEAPTIEIEGHLQTLPIKMMRVRIVDQLSGAQQLLVAEMESPHLITQQQFVSRIRGVDARGSKLDDKVVFGEVRRYGENEWNKLGLKGHGQGEAKFFVPELPTGLYELRIGFEVAENDRFGVKRWVTIGPEEPRPGVGTFTQKGRNAFYRGEEFWIGLGVRTPGEQIPSGQRIELKLEDENGRELSVYVGKTKAPIEERKTYVVRVGGEMSLKLAPGKYRLAAKLGSYSSPGRDISIVEPDPQTHFTTMLNGKYNVIGKQYEKVLKTCEGAEFLAREIKEAGYNTFMGMSYSLQRHNRKNTAIEQLVRERPSLGPWESYYQPSGRDRFMNAAVRNNLRFYENIFSHHDSMLPRHKAFLAAAERYASLELESMRHSPVFRGVCLYDEFYHSGGVHTAAIKDMFLKAQQMGFRERYDGLTVAEAKKALDRFVRRPPGRRRTEDVEKYRLWKEHEDWQWERFSRRMNGAIKDVMPSARTFALQRFGGSNGSNIAHNGPSEKVFGPLDIASCVMYKDGGFGDRPVFAPMQADVLSIRKNIPVWTQLHCFHGPGIYGRHLLRQAFFALSQKVEGFSFFTIGFDPENPRQLDNRDTIRTIAAELCRPYGDFFMACEKGYKKVGIYYSRTAAHLRQRKSLKLSYACEGLWVGCMRAGYPADFLYDTDIIEGRGMEYDVVFAPGWELVGECPPSIQKALKRLVNAGKIVATERSSKLPVKGISRLQSSLDEYDDKLGGAFPRYVDFETEMVWNRSEKTTQLVGDFLSKHIEPAGLVQKAEGTEELPVHVGPDWLKCGRGQYMIIPNFAYTRFDGLHKTLYQAPDRPTVKFPEKNPKCYDMLEMRSVEVERKDDWMIVRPDFRYYPGKIYAFLPREIGGVSLKASSEVKAGETIQYQARVTDDAGHTINAGFPIEIKLEHPLGRTLYDVYRVAKPVYSGAYAMPVNITPGNWTLSVRELIGGAIAKTKIKVGRGALPLGQYDGTTVFVHDVAQIRRFLKNNEKVIIARSESQQWLVPAARELSAGLKKMGIEAEIKNIDGIVRTAGDWNRKNPTADGTRMWRGTVVAPGLFVDAPVIVLGRRYENRLVEALIGRGTVPEPLTENFPGQGRAVVGHVRRAFSNEYDTLYIFSRDKTGIKRGIEKLISAEADVSAPVHPELVEPKVRSDAKLADQARRDWAPSSYRQNIWGEDLIRTIDVDPVSGRILVGTFGYGYNLFCLSEKGDLLWRKFLPEHDVYYARWYDQGIREIEKEEEEETIGAWENAKEIRPDEGYEEEPEEGQGEEVKKGARRVVAATGRGFHVFLLNGENGDVIKKFASTEWPNYHSTYTEGALKTEVPIRVNTPLKQILVCGKTAMVALDYEGNKIWSLDRADAITEYPEKAEQTGAATFPRSAVMRGFAISPDGSKIIHSQYRITGSTETAKEIVDVWGHLPHVIDARTGKILAVNRSNRGESTRACGWSVGWPENSKRPWVYRKGLGAPLQEDGSFGEFKLVRGKRLENGDWLQHTNTRLARVAANGNVVWEKDSEEVWIRQLDRLSKDQTKIYRCDPDGLIKCYDLENGETLWEYGGLDYSAVFRPTQKSLLAGAEDGDLVFLDSAGKAKWETTIRDDNRVPAGGYPGEIEYAEQRDPDSTAEFYPVGEDKPGDYKTLLRKGLEQISGGGFEAGTHWEIKDGKIESGGEAHRGKKCLSLEQGDLVSQAIERKVVPSATYLLEFFYKINNLKARLTAGVMLEGKGKISDEVLTASKFGAVTGARAGQWSFGRLAVKSMADTVKIRVGFEAEDGVVLVDDVSLKPIRFPSANLVACEELHAIEPTYVEDIRVQYDRVSGALKNKLRNKNRVAAFAQCDPNVAIIWTQEESYLHNGRLDDIGQIWRYQPDNVGFSVIFAEPMYVSHLVLYLNNATPGNVYQTIGVLANNIETKMPETVALVRGNRRRFVVVHFDEPVYTDNLKILPGPHRAHKECITEVEVYGPLGGPEMAEKSDGFSEAAPAHSMFMGSPDHAPKQLPEPLTGEYKEVARSSRIGTPAYHCGGSVASGLFTFGVADGRVRSVKISRSERRHNRPDWGRSWSLSSVAPTTAPARYRGRLLVGSADYKLHAVADNGMHLWGFETDGRVYSAPTPNGHEVYFGSDDGNLYKADIDSGMLIWRFETGGKVRSSPALSDGKLYFASWDGNLYALDAAKGRKVWQAAIEKFTRCSPAVRSGKVYIGDERGHMVCYSAKNGKLLWRKPLGDHISRCPVVLGDSVVYASEDGKIAAIMPSGSVRWRRDLKTRISGQPIPTREQLIVPTDNGLSVLKSDDGKDDERFVPPRKAGKIHTALPYKGFLCLLSGRPSVYKAGGRNFVNYGGTVEIWAPREEPETSETPEKGTGGSK